MSNGARKIRRNMAKQRDLQYKATQEASLAAFAKQRDINLTEATERIQASLEIQTNDTSRTSEEDQRHNT